MRKPLFGPTGEYRRIEAELVRVLNEEPEYLAAGSLNSPRAVGDAVQALVGARLGLLLGDLASDYSDTFARRAMADIAFPGADGNHYVVDVKTHRVDASFSMPNLISVERLSRFYEDDRNFFCLLLIRYGVDTRVRVQEVHFVPLEHVAWSCLTVGALGWGQIQIANASRLVIDETRSRAEWMIELCDVLDRFYPNEVAKIEKRLGYFARVREFWENKARGGSAPPMSLPPPPAIPDAED